jgi:hypothetical protein
MCGKWYARDYVDQANLDQNNMFEHISNGNVVSLADDLDTWCDEMNIDIKDVILA